MKKSPATTAAAKKARTPVKKVGKRGRPKKVAGKKVAGIAAGASNGRPLTAAKILKQQLKATQDMQQMHAGLTMIVNDDRTMYDTPVQAFKGLQRIAKDSLRGVRI